MPQRGRRRFQTLGERLEAYKQFVRQSMDLRQREFSRWQRTIRMYRTNMGVDDQDILEEDLQVNLIYSFIETMLPSLVFQDPVMTAKPLTPDSHHAVRTTEAAVTQELRGADLRGSLIRATVDAMLKGTGILQLGLYTSGLVPQAGTSAEQVEQGNEKSSDVPYGFRPGHLYVDDIRPENFLQDPMGMQADLGDSLWVGIEYLRQLDEIKHDPQYENTKGLQANAWMLPEGVLEVEHFEILNPETNLASLEWVRLIQFWDMLERKIYVFTMDHDMFLGRYDWSLPTRRFPFYPLQLTEDTGKFWKQAPTFTWRNMNEELNYVLRSRLEHLSKFKRKYLYRKDTIDEEDLDQLKSAEEGALIGVDPGPAGALSEAVQPLIDANVSPDSYAFTGEIQDTIRKISGVSEFDQGATRAGERPAAEIERISSGANIRRQGMASRITSPVKQMAVDTTRIMRRFYTRENVIQIVGDDGRRVWTPWTGGDVGVDNEWDVSIEDMRPMTREARLTLAQTKVAALAPFGQGGLGLLDLKPHVEEMAREMGVREVRWLPQASDAPQDPGYEWFLMEKRGESIRPNPLEDLGFHLFVHNTQLEAVLSDPRPDNEGARQALLNHVAETSALLQEQQRVLAGLQQQQQPGGGAPGQPGPAQGSPSGNPTGGSGVFAGSNGTQQQPQPAAGGGQF